VQAGGTVSRAGIMHAESRLSRCAKHDACKPRPDSQTCIDVLQGMEESPTKLAARRQARGDIESAVRDTNCADSCSSLDGYGKPPYGSSGSDDGGGSPGVLDWKSDANEAGEGLQPSDSAGDRRGCWCSGGTSVALICLLLTLSSFVVPKSNEHVGAVIGHAQRLGSRAKQLGDRAREDASFQKSALIAKMQGKRHCRAPPRTLRDGTVQRVRVAGVSMASRFMNTQPASQLGRGPLWLVLCGGLLRVSSRSVHWPTDSDLTLQQTRPAHALPAATCGGPGGEVCDGPAEEQGAVAGVGAL